MLKRGIRHIILISVLLFSAIGLSLCGLGKSNGNQDENVLINKIDDYLDWEEQNGFSGIIKIKIKDEVEFTRTFGYANREEQIPINEKTVFDIGSLTKHFTAAAILKLEMEGKLNVRDSLPKFFSNVPDDKASISIHHLLTHTSGLKATLGLGFRRSTKAQMLDKLFDSELISDPGTQYNFSHLGYSLLGAIIEKISGKSYEQYLNDKIFKPAGMSNTGYVLPLWREEEIAHGYRNCRDWGKPMDGPWDVDGPYWNIRANGGLLSSAEDLMLWLDAMENSDILSESEKENFFQPFLNEAERGGSNYSYGWLVAISSRNTRVLAHKGDNWLFFTEVLRYMTEDVTIMVLSNNGKPGNDNIAFELAKIIFWPDHQPRVQGSVINCLDSLPASRMGHVASKFLASVSNNMTIENIHQTDAFFNKDLQNRHSEQHILRVLNRLNKHMQEPVMKRVIITDYSIMEISFICKKPDGEGNERLYLKLFFDEEEYLIKKLEYDSWNR